MKTRALGATAGAVLLSLLAPAAPAFGSGPVEGTPGTFLTVTPSTNLSASHNVSVSGTGYGNAGTAVILQCGVQPGQNLEDCVDRGTAPVAASGSFGPVQVTVTVTFQPEGAAAIDCRTTTCSVFVANSFQPKNAKHPISFSGGQTGSDNTVANFDGDADTDVSIYRPSNGQWYILGGNPSFVVWGAQGDIPVPADYTGDGRTDVAVFRPSNGQWFIQGGNPSFAVWGAQGDIPVPADYTGDGKADIAVYRPSNGQWFIMGGNPSFVSWGAQGDIPVPADYTGDGRADVAVFRPSNGQWFILGGNPSFVVWGAQGDMPVPADYTGDGKADVAVFRPSNGQWHIRGGNPSFVIWGAQGDVPLPLPYAIRQAFF